MKNKETLQAVMDRRLSFLDGLPSCRPALMQRIAQEEAPVMKKKVSFVLVFALVLVSLSVVALAAGLILSPRVTAAQLADRELEKAYGITYDMQTFFARAEEELEDGTFRVTYTGAGALEAPLGVYTVDVKDGKAKASWNLDGKDTSGGYDAEAWGLEQIAQMLTDSRAEDGTEAYIARAEQLWAENHPDENLNAPSEPAETFEEYYARREAAKTGAMNARKKSEEEMITAGREFIITTFGLTDEQAARLELYTNSFEGAENEWYETVNGKPCFKVEFLLDEEGYDPEAPHDETEVRNNAYYNVFINVETGVIEQYEFDSGAGGIG